MNKTVWLGKGIKEDNGSGYRVVDGLRKNPAFARRRFHDDVSYTIRFCGVNPEAGNIVSITRAR